MKSAQDQRDNRETNRSDLSASSERNRRGSFALGDSNGVAIDIEVSSGGDKLSGSAEKGKSKECEESDCKILTLRQE